MERGWRMKQRYGTNYKMVEGGCIVQYILDSYTLLLRILISSLISYLATVRTTTQARPELARLDMNVNVLYQPALACWELNSHAQKIEGGGARAGKERASSLGVLSKE